MSGNWAVTTDDGRRGHTVQSQVVQSLPHQPRKMAIDVICTKVTLWLWLCISFAKMQRIYRKVMGGRLSSPGWAAELPKGSPVWTERATKSSHDYRSSRTFLNRPLSRSKSLAREYGLLKPLGCFPLYFSHDVQETLLSQMVLPSYGSFSPWEGLGKLFLLPPALHPQVLLLFSLPVYGG